MGTSNKTPIASMRLHVQNEDTSIKAEPTVDEGTVITIDLAQAKLDVE